MLSCNVQLIEPIFWRRRRKIVAQTMLDKLQKMNKILSKL